MGSLSGLLSNFEEAGKPKFVGIFFHTAVYVARNNLEQSWQEEEEEEEANCHLATCVGRPPIPDLSRCTPRKLCTAAMNTAPRSKKHGKKVPDCPACLSFGATEKKTVIL